MPLTHGCHRSPPDMPQPGIDPATLRLRDLRLARLSEAGILVCGGGGGHYAHPLHLFDSLVFFIGSYLTPLFCLVDVP